MVTPKKNKDISQKILILDVILRSHQDERVEPISFLERKSNNPDILDQLLAIERAIIKKARSQKII